ncbi:hypothetical protein D3C81_1751770 [compost metagenome]
MDKKVPVNTFLLIVIEDYIIGLNLNIHDLGGFANSSLKVAIKNLHLRRLATGCDNPY